METLKNAPDFDFDSGELCLDFANTLDWHASASPGENFNSYPDLVAFTRQAGLIDEAQAQRLLKAARKHPDQAKAALERAVELREAIYRIFVSQIDQEPAAPKDLEILNAVLRQGLQHFRVTPAPQGFAFDLGNGGENLQQMLWPVAWSAVELLTSERLERVGQCADDRGCGYLFFDTSRNRSRRWCSMESCGNRAKAMRHYERKIGI